MASLTSAFLIVWLAAAPQAHAGPSSPLYDNGREPLANEDFMRLTKAGYKFVGEGQVLKPETGEPVESVEMPRLLDELESRQRLEAMLGLNLIFSRFGYKDLPPEALEEVRRLGRQNWKVFSASLRGDLKSYFSGPELEAMDKGVSLVKMPRTWLIEDLGPPSSESLLETGTGWEPPAPRPVGRPLSVAETMPTTALPAPWANEPPRRPTTSPPPIAGPPASPAGVVATLPVAPAPPPLPPPPAPVRVVPAPAPVVAALPPAVPVPAVVPLPSASPPPTAAPGAAPPVAGPPAALMIDGRAMQFPGRMIDPAAAIQQAAATPKPVPPPSPAAVPAAPVPVPAPPEPPKVVEMPAPSPIAPSEPRVAFVEYPQTTPEGFTKFLTDAPYGHEAHHLLKLIARHAEREDRRVALGVVQRHVPAFLIDPARAGTAMRAAIILAPGDLGVGKAIVVLHSGPVVAGRRRLLASSGLAFVPENPEFYTERGLAVPILNATAAGAASVKEEESDWGRARVFEDGSRRLRPSPEQLAGTLLEQLLRLDARARGWKEAYRGGLRARAAQLRFYRRIASETGAAPRLDRALAAEYTEWLNRPLDWSDHWLQALASPGQAHVAPSLSGDLEERLRAKASVEGRVLAGIGLAPERSAPAPQNGGDEFIERERQGRIERELKALSDGGPEARAWISAEQRFRLELTADAK